MNDTLPDDEVRDAAQIARRALALFGSVGVAFRTPRADVLRWLSTEGLWDECTTSEKEFLSAEQPTNKQIIDASWKSEELIVLLWALVKVERLPAPNEQCDTALFHRLLPPFADVTVSSFISSASRRSDQELIDMADQLMDLHWQARDARRRKNVMPPALDIEVIQERHHAINWVIGCDGAPWDEVTTDT